VFLLGLCCSGIRSTSFILRRVSVPSPWDAESVGCLAELLKYMSSLIVLIPAKRCGCAACWGLLLGTIPGEPVFSPVGGSSPVPPTIYIPYAIACCPLTTAAGSWFFVGAFWPVFLNTCRRPLAAATLPDNARSRLKRTEYLWRIVFPHAAALFSA